MSFSIIKKITVVKSSALRRSNKRQNIHSPKKSINRGYLLPVVIALGLAISTMSAYTIQTLTYNSITTNEQYYKTIASEAAQAGVAAAVKCIESNETTWGVNGKPELQPQTDCDGADIANVKKTILEDGIVSTTYTVKSLENPYNNTTRLITVTGTTILSDAGGRKLAQYTDVARALWMGTEGTGGLSAIFAGGYQSCTISIGRAYCWGDNLNHALGNGNGPNDALVPNLPVTSWLSPIASRIITQVSINADHACAIANTLAYCWGSNSDGQNGNNTASGVAEPMLVVQTPAGLGGKVVQSLDVGVVGQGTTCAIADAKPYCWGDNTWGRFGNGTTTDSNIPVATSITGVLSGKVATDVAVGDLHVCVIASSAPYCWGYNRNGRLGNGTETDSVVPVAVNMLGVLAGKTVKSIDAGRAHTCVVADGGVYCWGNNNNGQLGNNSMTDSMYPAAVNSSGVLSGKTVTSVTTGQEFTCVIADGKPYCWGQNTKGQLGIGNTSTRAFPVAVDTTGVLAGKTVTDIAAGRFHVCVIADGKPYCWGDNTQGQLGNNTRIDSSVPVAVDISAVPVDTSGQLTTIHF
ncbi:MAG: hypothetical protein QG549_70 [Patescibacteria group bacterium]|nr:hypothetical protein [Patescibacteria group bacterium]